MRYSGVKNWNKWRRKNPNFISKLAEANPSKVKSFYKVRLDAEILSEIKSSWPEKLATIPHYTNNDLVIDMALLA
jgi:hypothetical protein